MKIIEPQVTLLNTQSYEDMLQNCELAARTSYQSFNRMEDGSAERLLKFLIKAGHLSILEFAAVTFQVITDRAIQNEMVRHRIGCSYVVESTRYVNYKEGLSVIKPDGLTEPAYNAWENAMYAAEQSYFDLLKNGMTPQIARSVLPLSLATTVTVQLNMRALRNFLQLRLAKTAHPSIRIIAQGMYHLVERNFPIFLHGLHIDGSVRFE